MSVLDPVLATLGAEIAERSARLGRRVDVAHLGILDRAGQLELGGPGRVSANGACQLIAAADGWIAVNLAREEDREELVDRLLGLFLLRRLPDGLVREVFELVKARQAVELRRPREIVRPGLLLRLRRERLHRARARALAVGRDDEEPGALMYW